MLLDGASLIFPNLGITINTLYSGFFIGNYYIAFYGVVIAIGMILAVVLSMLRAKQTNQYPDDYIDLGIFGIISAIVGARLYYVVFRLNEFHSFKDVINIRNGGLAIYGGLIFGFTAGYFVCRFKKMSILRALDTVVPGVAIAQAIGRWGNFFNREAYGGFTDSLFAMQIKYSEANGIISEELSQNMQVINDIEYIQVHPTFLYESAWCVLLFIALMLLSKLSKYKGEIFLWYVTGYSLERFFVEGLRTDQLCIGNIAVSQILSLALFVGAVIILVYNRIRLANKSWDPDYRYVLEDGEVGSKTYREDMIESAKAKRKAKGEEAAEESAETSEADAETSETPEETCEACAEAAEETCESCEEVEETEKTEE